jgi:hypothetical protein
MTPSFPKPPRHGFKTVFHRVFIGGAAAGACDLSEKAVDFGAKPEHKVNM